MSEWTSDRERDLDFIWSFLPEDWEHQAFVLHALWRRRKITNAKDLLRILLVHVGQGLSLRETAVRCRLTGGEDLTDTAILHRLKHCGPWVSYLCRHLVATLAPREFMTTCSRRLLAVDATTVREPGPTGSCWRLHYLLDLGQSHCAEAFVTGPKEPERLSRFTFQLNDLVFADRGYSRASDVAHVRTAGAQVVIRYRHRSMTITDTEGQPLDLLPRLRALAAGEVGDYPVVVTYRKQQLSGRLCAVRKSPEAMAREQRRIKDRRRRKGTKHGHPETLEMAAYFVVFTTEPATGASAREILHYYAWRWQVEICFKRMKGLFDFGHLPKHLAETVGAWLELKLLTALLVESLRRHAESFSPWGYPL